MLFRFDVEVTPKDFFEFAKFHCVKKGDYAKTMLKYRIILPVAVVFVGAISLMQGEFDKNFAIKLAIYAIGAVIALLTMKKRYFNNMRRYIDNKAKKNENDICQRFAVEFYEDGYTLFVPESRVDESYSAIVEVCTGDSGGVFLYDKNGKAIILPGTVFALGNQNETFVNFIKGKIEQYKEG